MAALASKSRRDGSCAVTVAFTPAATGAKTGSIVFPVTYVDNTTAKLTATFAGKGDRCQLDGGGFADFGSV